MEEAGATERLAGVASTDVSPATRPKIVLRSLSSRARSSVKKNLQKDQSAGERMVK